MLVTGVSSRRSAPMSRIMPISSSSTVCGRRNEGMLVRMRPPGVAELLEDRDLVAERHQIVGDRERRRPRADAGDALAVPLLRRARQPAGQVVAVVGGDALQAADRDRLLLDAAAAAGGLAGAVADAAEDAREDVGLAVDQVGVGEAALGDQADVFRHVGVGRAGPLAVDDAMIIVGMRGISRVHGSVCIAKGQGLGERVR